MAKIKVFLADSWEWRFRSDFRESYNFVVLCTGKLRFCIGRPVIPVLNKIIRWYQGTKLFKAKLYLRTCKQQIDADVNYITDYSGKLIKHQIRESWNLEIIRKELDLQITGRLKRILEKKTDKYYFKRQMTREVPLEVTDGGHY